MAGPLDGVRIIELTTMITGPLAGMLLADLGASVIKIENPEGGDPFRYFRGGLYGGHFIAYNRNKRSLTLDLRSRRGKEILRDLIAGRRRADRQFPSRRAGPARLSRRRCSTRINPRLIHCSLTGFGRDGPYRDRPSYDAVAQSLSRRAEPVRRSATSRSRRGRRSADNITGFYAAYGILGALYERERTGKGRRVETSMLEATIAFAPDAFINNKRYGIPVGPLTRVSASQSYAFRCQDGQLIAIHMSSQLKFWEGLLAALERPDIGQRSRASTAASSASTITRRCATSWRKTFATRTRAEWAQRLEAQDVPYAPVYGVERGDGRSAGAASRNLLPGAAPDRGRGLGRPSAGVLSTAQRPGTIAPPPVLGEHSERDAWRTGTDVRNEIAELQGQRPRSSDPDSIATAGE